MNAKTDRENENTMVFFWQEPERKNNTSINYIENFSWNKNSKKKTNEVASFAAFVRKNNQDIKNLETLKLF